MSNLRFAIIKCIKTMVGNNYEDVVYEYNQEKIYRRLRQLFYDYLPFKPTRFWKKPRYTEEEIMSALDKAWVENIEEFKEVTITIF